MDAVPANSSFAARRASESPIAKNPRVARHRSMGAWGDGPFENDSALDWVAEVLEGGLDTVLAVLFEAKDYEYRPGPPWERQIAALEIVAALRGHRLNDMDASLAIWCADQPRLGLDMEDIAQKLARALQGNEHFLELFGERVGGRLCYPPLDDLISRLTKDARAQAPVTPEIVAEHEELARSPGVAFPGESDLGNEFGVGGTVVPQSGDVVGIPLKEDAFALGVLLDVCTFAGGTSPPITDGTILVLSATSSAEDADLADALGNAKAIAVDRYMLGFVQVGLWPVLASGYDSSSLLGRSSEAIGRGARSLIGDSSGSYGPSELSWLARAWHRYGPCNMYAGGPNAILLRSDERLDTDLLPADLKYL